MSDPQPLADSVPASPDGQPESGGARSKTRPFEQQIGNQTFTVYPSRPEDWSMENDPWREITLLSPGLHRCVTWVGRVAYAIEVGSNAVVLPLQMALTISREIAADEQAKRSAKA